MKFLHLGLDGTLLKQWEFRRHSFDLEWKWRLGNLSEQVEHVSVSNVAMFA